MYKHLYVKANFEWFFDIKDVVGIFPYKRRVNSDLSWRYNIQFHGGCLKKTLWEAAAAAAATGAFTGWMDGCWFFRRAEKSSWWPELPSNSAVPLLLFVRITTVLKTRKFLYNFFFGPAKSKEMFWGCCCCCCCLLCCI